MDQIPLVTSSTRIPVENFWNSISIYQDRPNVVNRKLAAVSPVLFCKILLHCPRIKHIYEIFTREALLYEIRKLQDLSKITPEFIKKITENYDKDALIEKTTWDTFTESIDGTFISLRVLFPRSSQENCLELVIFDKEKKFVTFFAIQESETHIMAPRFPYHIELTQNGNVRIILNSFEDADTSSAEWLADKVFPKLLKWTENGIIDDTIIRSLSLVAANEYCALYSELKLKFGEDLVKQWPKKTKTDPTKYVFEDIAIATYLICLWRKLETQDINFVDCGCGNGLLVYILNKQGYKGCGLDIRRRKVWELYSNEADLKIGTITPESTFPEATWLIGNHSDELTPWIPVIALNSSPKTNYFVLPCCSYDFSGRKYIRLNNSLSQYGDYLEYIKKISNLCGFETSIDKLRIPSTRRTCLVGIRSHQNVGDFKITVSDFINERLNVEFSPKNAVERVRNCTHLSKTLVENILNLVVTELLKTKNMMTKDVGDFWNQGGTRNLNDLCHKISSEDRKSLKNECGGLQTFLKNRRYIFDVRKGAVSLRKPFSLKESNKYKDKLCWFFQNHPDGCFFQSEACAYQHIKVV